MGAEEIQQWVESLFCDDLHARRVLSLAHGVLGVLHSASLAIHAIGQGLAKARGGSPKHATKQIDRLLSNAGLVLDDILRSWVAFLVAQRQELLVTIDWTDFDEDDQTTIAINLVTSHGRATPLLWRTHKKSTLKDRRNSYEDELLARLHDYLPLGRKVTVLADRGFGDQKLYTLMKEWDFDFVIRFRGLVVVEQEDGTKTTAAALTPGNGRPKMYKNVKVTRDRTEVNAVVCVKARGMKEAWHLATSRADLTATNVMKLYGRRFTTEENFRDTKDIKFGLGMSSTHIEDCERRDRLLLLAAMAEALLTLLGAASEACGLDRQLKVNTAKKRTHSLFRQGLYWYEAIPTMREEWLRPLMTAFGELLVQHSFFSDILGVI
jgi:hypothetical protein